MTVPERGGFNQQFNDKRTFSDYDKDSKRQAAILPIPGQKFEQQGEPCCSKEWIWEDDTNIHKNKDARIILHIFLVPACKCKSVTAEACHQIKHFPL
ncbi:MAG: hypothetical protein Q3Y08_01315 [Butyricicoccus sp.]|nr:hypothetical protein [Butyricicoccus sp.]